MAIGDIVPLDGGGAVAIGGLNAISNMRANDLGALTQMAGINAQTQQANQQAQLQQQQMMQDRQIAGQDYKLRQQQVGNQRNAAMGDQLLQAKQIQMQQQQQAEAKGRQQEMQQAFTSGDMGKYKSLLAVHNPEALATLNKSEQDIKASLLGQQKDAADLEGKQLENFKVKVGIAAPAAQAVIKNPQLYDSMQGVFKAVDPNAPDHFDPNYVMGLASLGGSDNGGTKKQLPATAVQNIGHASEGLAAVKDLSGAIDKNINMYGAAYLPNQLKSEDQQAFSLANNMMMQSIGYLKTGAAITGSEEERFKQLTLQPGDTPETQLNKLSKYTQRMMEVKKNLDPNYDDSEDQVLLQNLNVRLDALKKPGSNTQTNKTQNFFGDLVPTQQAPAGQ
jgi:hypothetical protein